MLQVTDQQLTNLHYLRDVVFPHVREMDSQGRVNFDMYTSACGTYRCLLGWALTDDFFRRQGAGISISGPYLGHETHPIEVISMLFGTDGPHSSNLFGLSYRGNLDTRAAHLDRIIAEREAALA